MILMEDILKDIFYIADRLAVSKTGDRGVLDKIEASHVVDAVYMVGMGVSIQNRVDMLDAVTQRLMPEICCCVDKDVLVVARDNNRRAGSPVLWIG